MYFCNFLDYCLYRNSDTYSKIEIDEEFKNGVAEASFVLNSEDNCINIVKGVHDKGISLIDKLSSSLVGCKDEDLAPTDDNPLILVATKSFKVPVGVKTYIKYLPVKGGVLVLLLKGVLFVEGVDGSYAPLGRNIVVEGGYEESQLVTFDADTVDNLNLLKDIQSGVPYNYNVISDCIINYTRDKNNNLIKSVRFNNKCFYVLNQKSFDDGLALKKAEDDRKEQERLERIKRAEAFAEAQKEKRLREAEEKANKARKKKSSTVSDSNKSKTVDTSKVSAGAKNFLDFLNSIK